MNKFSYNFSESDFAAEANKSPDPLDFSDIPDFIIPKVLYDVGAGMCDVTDASKGFQQIKNYPNDFHFDLIIYDYSFALCLYGLLMKFNYPPLIGISAFNNPTCTADIMGGDRLGMTTKPFYSLPYDRDMKIYQRFYNGFLSFYDSL